MKKAGEFWVPSDDSYFAKIFERGETFQLDRLEVAMQYVTDWSCAVDGGAHVGSWSIIMAEAFDKVIAIEASSDTYKCLMKNTLEYGHVSLIHAALGNMDLGTASVCDDKTRVGNSGSRFVNFDTSGDVNNMTLDSLNLDSLGFLKLDVEGCELFALEGAVKTIKKFKPVIFMEVKKGMAERFDIETNAPVKFLNSLGAKMVKRIKSDCIFIFE